MTHDNVMRRKALLAILFAGGILNAAPAAFSQIHDDQSISINQRIVDHKEFSAELRGYYLLLIAEEYLEGKTKPEIESSFNCVLTERPDRFLRKSERIDELYSWRAEFISTQKWGEKEKRAQTNESGNKSASSESVLLAQNAIQQALTQIETGGEPFIKLNAYFIVSKLYERMGNKEGTRKYENLLEGAFQDCERSLTVDEAKIKAATSILNAQAYGIVSIKIPEMKVQASAYAPEPIIKAYPLKDLIESERLRLRAVAMTDRLSTTNHLRRKAHRDMAIWYSLLGKRDLAEKEKQTLFDLIGVKDDKMLYPQSVGCGHLVWWEKEVTNFTGCGMG